MKRKTVVFQSEQTSFDHETGEIREEAVSKVFKLPSEPPYVKMYIEDICLLNGVPKALENTLRVLLMRLDYEGFIALSARSRKSLCQRLNISAPTLSNRLGLLCKAGLLCREGNNDFMVNPKYFARGDWKSICEMRKAFEVRIKYSEEKGREVESLAVVDQGELELSQD